MQAAQFGHCFVLGLFFAATWAGLFRHDFEMLYDFLQKRETENVLLEQKNSRTFYRILCHFSIL